MRVTHFLAKSASIYHGLKRVQLFCIQSFTFHQRRMTTSPVALAARLLLSSTCMVRSLKYIQHTCMSIFENPSIQELPWNTGTLIHFPFFQRLKKKIRSTVVPIHGLHCIVNRTSGNRTAPINLIPPWQLASTNVLKCVCVHRQQTDVSIGPKKKQRFYWLLMCALS